MHTRAGIRGLAIAVFLSGIAAVSPVSAASPDDACALVTQAKVTSVLGVTMGAGTYVTPEYLKTCTWTPSGGSTKGIDYVTLRACRQVRGWQGSDAPDAVDGAWPGPVCRHGGNRNRG